MEFKDYYKIMGVTEKADADEIKRSYRKLARKYHPDVSKESDAEARFKEVGEAYEVLHDPEKRAEYDQLRSMGAYRHNGRFKPPPNWSSASSFNAGGFTEADPSQFSEFFRSIFGSDSAADFTTQTRGFRRRGEDSHFKLALFLEEADKGCEKQLQFSIREPDGTGQIIERTKTLKVKIPAGVVEGQHIRLKGQGGTGIGGEANGDLFIEIQLAPHPLFTVRDRDVYLTLPVAPWEAALGATVDVPSLRGKLRVKINKGSRSGDKLRLKGKGLSGSTPGDQFVVLQITLPGKLSEETEKLYRQLAEQEKDFNPRAELTAKMGS